MYKDDIIIIQRRHCCLALFATPNTLVKFPEYESPGINDDTSTIIAKFTGIIYKILEIITIQFLNFNLR